MEPRDPTQVKPGAAGVCVSNSAGNVIDIDTGAELGLKRAGRNVCTRSADHEGISQQSEGDGADAGVGWLAG
jgi:hypothetical protein